MTLKQLNLVIGLKSWDLCLGLVEKNLNSALANNTSKQYKYWWKRFEEFCTSNGRQIEPFSDLTAAAFLSCLAEESAGIGGVDQARAALRHFHNRKFPGITCPTDSVRISAVLKGIKRRFQKPVFKKKALQSKDFSRLFAFITMTNQPQLAVNLNNKLSGHRHETPGFLDQLQ